MRSAVARTRAFYEWEMRGRGWIAYSYPVALEPAFRPFLSHQPVGTAQLDDGRRVTLLSRFIDQFRSDDRSVALRDKTLPEPEPQESEEIEFDELLVTLPEGARVARPAVLGWLRSLSAVSGPLSFELLGGDRRVEVRLAAPKADTPYVLRQLEAVVPPVVVRDVPEPLEECWRTVTDCASAAVEFGLACEFMVPLATERPPEEPLLPLIAALADIGEGELGLYQVLFEQAQEPWAESVLRSVVTPHGKPFFADAPELTSLAKEKVSSALFAVVVRVAGAAADIDRAWEIVRRMGGGLSHFGTPRTNELISLPTDDVAELEVDIRERVTHRSGMLLSAEELVSLVQLPGAGVHIPELVRARERTKAAPEEVTGDGCLLGTNEHRGESVQVRLPADARSKHVHIVGASGTGKSTLLVRMILADIEAGHGVAVLDPHGDLVDEVAGRLPEDRCEDVVFFDPSDEQTAVGWNILAAQSEVEKDLLASDLVGVFRRLSTSWGDQMTAVLANAIVVFLESKRGGSLEELRRFLVDERFRTEMLGTVDDPHITSFWETEFPLLIGRRPQAPILTRLDTFLRSKIIRRVVTAREPSLDFRELVDRGQIFLGKLAAGAIGQENAALLGSLLVSRFHQVTLARGAQAAEARRPFFLFIDEFHDVATTSMAALFSGVRKYRLGLTVAHQNLYQLHSSVPDVERSVMANAYTRICFRVGEEDARQLAKGLSFFTPEDLMGLRLGEAICRVGSRDADFNLRTDPLDPRAPDELLRRREHVRSLSAPRWGASAREDAPVASEPGPVSDQPTPELRAPAPIPPEHPEVRQKAREQVAAPQRTPQTEPVLDKATLDYLHLVAVEPFLAVRERNRRLGLSAWKGQRIKSELLEAGLAREVAISPGGRGKRFKLLELTPEGRAVLSRYGISQSAGHGRGGIAHQWWVATIAAWLKERGVEAEIEDASLGSRVDLSYEDGGIATAVEVEMSEGHVEENIHKDIEAGYARIVCLLDNPASVERLRERLPSDQTSAEIRIEPLQEFESVLAALIAHPSSLSPLRAPNQNQEPRARRRRSRRPASPPVAQPADVSVDLFEPGALSTPAAATYVGLSPATLETLRTRGGGPAFMKLGRRVVYSREDLDRWLADRRRGSTSEVP